MFDLIGPVIELVWPLIVIVFGFIGVFVWGRKKKKEGVEEEKERSRKVVNKVQKEMNKETQKPVTKEELQKRLKDGTF